MQVARVQVEVAQIGLVVPHHHRRIGSRQRICKCAGGPVPAPEAFSALLLSYASETGIERAIHRTARRLKKPQGLLDAMHGWREQLPELRVDLPVLLGDLRELSERFDSVQF